MLVVNSATGDIRDSVTGLAYDAKTIKHGQTLTVSYTYPIDPDRFLTPVQKLIKSKYPAPRHDRYSRHKR
jgi:hypothetical protein